MINIEKLIADFEDCLGWPYKTPGTNDSRGIDCSGMFVRAYRLQGQRIYHGSNTIWRKHLREKGPIDSVRDLRPGMAVFKWKPDTPSKFRDDEGDFCHIGLVTSVNPLRIVHASTEGMKVKADRKIGKWKYWGILAAAEPENSLSGKSAGESAPLFFSETLYKATLRRGHRGSDVKFLQRVLRQMGYDLEIDGIFGRITLECVKSFQATHELVRDGIVGPLTWAKLEEACKEVNET